MAELLRRKVDYLGLRSAFADRVLPVLVAAMSFLAALAVAGNLASAALAQNWQADTASALTVQVPDPDLAAKTGTAGRLNAVLAALGNAPGVSGAQVMSEDAVDKLLAPWLGGDVASLALPLPAVIAANFTGPGSAAGLAAGLDAIAPGTLVSSGADWAGRVAALTGSLQACAASVLAIVALVAAAIVAVATRSGLAQRREAIEIIHGLGALDGDIADRFAARAMGLTAIGAICGVGLALPVLLWLAALTAPFDGVGPQAGLAGLPMGLWASLPALPALAAAIGWATAQMTVRGWLRSLA